MFQVNQRVITHKYGAGTIKAFERLMTYGAVHFNEYLDGDRIAIQLDTPANWPLHSETSGLPHFVPSDIA